MPCFCVSSAVSDEQLAPQMTEVVLKFKGYYLLNIIKYFMILF